jgi:DNA-binding MarR family transcriptional regulator
MAIQIKFENDFTKARDKFLKEADLFRDGERFLFYISLEKDVLDLSSDNAFSQMAKRMEFSEQRLEEVIDLLSEKGLIEIRESLGD